MKNTFTEKLYYKIGEVAKITDIESYVLRYWESEFGIFKPQKSISKHRRYKRKDIDIIFEIKRLLYEERYTIEGAKKKLKEFHKDKLKQMNFDFSRKRMLNTIKIVEQELKEIEAILN